MKIIAFYLPQFHCIPENDEWWGKGFTEWVNVKKAQKYFSWQRQPRIPLNNNYYNLLDKNTQEWQADLAKKYGIYGFCYYHYWFNGHMLLEKPIEEMLKNKRIDLPFCICWANEDWTNAWVSDNAKVLISQDYGDKKDWTAHYNYLSTFFKDERYIKNNGKPLLVIYKPDIIPCLNELLQFWDDLAKKDGFAGIDYAHQYVGLDFPIKKDDSAFAFDIEMQPAYGKIYLAGKKKNKRKSKLKRVLDSLKLSWVIRAFKKVTGPQVFDYDEVWKAILETKPISDKSVGCAFVDFDNTSRRKRQGWLFKGATPEKFEHYFSLYCEKVKKEYKYDTIFIFAWNEWAEGGYLEPDEDNRYAYLEAISSVINNKEF